MKAELNKQGYRIGDLKIEFSSDYSEIEKIEIFGANSLDIENIKQYFSENYCVDSEKIFFL